MKHYFNRVLLVVFCSLLVLTLSGSKVHAQTEVGLQLKPAIVEGQVSPSETQSFTLTVTNISAVERTLYVGARDITGIDAEGRPIFSDSNEVTGFELSSWITLSQPPFTLGPGVTKTITFTVSVPDKASPGSHFASILFSDKPTQQTTSGAGVGYSVGAIVSLRIAGDIKEEAQLREFSTGKIIYPTADVDFKVRIHNSGNLLVQPRGLIEISNMFGKQVASVAVNEALASVFPNAERSYQVQWKVDGFAFGRYQAVATLSYGSSGTGQKSINSTTSFWILPIVPILAVLGMFTAIVVGIYLLMKAYIRKKLRQMGVTNASRSDADFYSRKYQKSSSSLVVVTMSVILLCLVFLVVTFLMFA